MCSLLEYTIYCRYRGIFNLRFIENLVNSFRSLTSNSHNIAGFVIIVTENLNPLLRMSTTTTKLFVGHLPDGCTNDDLFTLFSKYGEVTECDVINKYGFVHMSTAEEAEEAMKALNDYYFKGSSLSVEPSKSKLHLEPGSEGRARGGSTFRGRGFGRGGGYSNGYGRRYEGPVFGGGRDFYSDRGYSSMSPRMRPYPTPYDRPSMGPSLRDQYPYRSSPYSSALRDPYSARSGTLTSLSSVHDLYDRRATAYPSQSDYLYSRRSPTSQMDPGRSYWYNDSLGDSMSRMPSTSRRPYF